MTNKIGKDRVKVTDLVKQIPHATQFKINKAVDYLGIEKNIEGERRYFTVSKEDADRIIKYMEYYDKTKYQTASGMGRIVGLTIQQCEVAIVALRIPTIYVKGLRLFEIKSTQNLFQKAKDYTDKSKFLSLHKMAKKLGVTDPTLLKIHNEKDIGEKYVKITYFSIENDEPKLRELLNK